MKDVTEATTIRTEQHSGEDVRIALVLSTYPIDFKRHFYVYKCRQPQKVSFC